MARSWIHKDTGLRLRIPFAVDILYISGINSAIQRFGTKILLYYDYIAWTIVWLKLILAFAN